MVGVVVALYDVARLVFASTLYVPTPTKANRRDESVQTWVCCVPDVASATGHRHHDITIRGCAIILESANRSGLKCGIWQV